MNDYDESMRHKDPFGIIQEMRTKELIERYLPDKKTAILDVGGANGFYSFYLANLGHDVSLLDIAPNHIKTAKKINSEKNNKLSRIILGDVQDFETTSKYDIIILHGPLYHLIKKENRIKVLQKMKRLLNPEGFLLGFGINRYAGYFYGIRTGHILNKEYKASVQEELRTGIRKKPPGWYFHKPDEMVAEYKEAGLMVVNIKSVTTQVWMLPKIENILKDVDKIKEIMNIAKDTEDFLEIGQDLFCVGKMMGS